MTLRTGTISGFKEGMATVVYGNGSGEASVSMPVLVSADNRKLKPGDPVVVAPLNGKKDGIVLGRFWSRGTPYQRSED